MLGVTGGTRYVGMGQAGQRLGGAIGGVRKSVDSVNLTPPFLSFTSIPSLATMPMLETQT